MAIALREKGASVVDIGFEKITITIVRHDDILRDVDTILATLEQLDKERMI